MKKKIQTGDVWLARWEEMPGRFWAFQIIATIKDEENIFYVAVKRDVELDGLYLHMFDEEGNEVHEIHGDRFKLYRKSEKQPRYTSQQVITEQVTK